jgi:class 3 adenylate cyclase/YHS domain-containing protein
MEQNTGILMADLSGYTALTETHGAATAADIIDTYLKIVDDCLVGDATLHQCVGDEVMIIASPDHLLSTAIVLIQNCSKEKNFLQIHGALHYGKILKRNNNYFGAPVNLTSRIAGKANKGSFWCSTEFVNALSDKSAFTFSSQGKHSFKNVNEEIEVFELIIENPHSVYVDPVCRMLIHTKETATPHPEKDIFFCSENCLRLYINSEH